MSDSNGSIGVARSTGAAEGYSSLVRLWVRSGERELPLAQVGGGRMFFDEPTVLPDSAAVLVIEVDGEARCTPVEVVSDGAPATVFEYQPRA